jgi:hypothetical protein
MKKLFGVAMLLASAAWVAFGGWAVVSVADAPDHLIVGKPQTLSFTVRQHGVEKLRGLEPRIEARKGMQRVTGRVTSAGEVYRAAITVPSDGDWAVTIESGFGRSKGRLLPMRAVNSTQQLAAISEVERGRRMFAARGCVTCHVHSQVGLEGDLQDFGPDLSNRRFAADYLAKFLADPSIKPADANKRMPNPMLASADIGPIVAFINGERRVTSR